MEHGAVDRARHAHRCRTRSGPRGDAPVAESGPQIRGVGVPVGLPRHPRVRPARAVGTVPVDLQAARHRNPVRAPVLPHRSAIAQCCVPVRGDRPGAQRGRVHGRDRPRRNRLGSRRSARSLHRAGNVVGADDPADRASSGHARDHPPTGNELISMLKTTSLVAAVPYTAELYARARDIAGSNFQPIPLFLVAATGTWRSRAS